MDVRTPFAPPPPLRFSLAILAVLTHYHTRTQNAGMQEMGKIFYLVVAKARAGMIFPLALCSFPGSISPEITTRTVLHGPPRRGLFLFLGEFKNASQAGPDRFVASPDNQDGACVFPRIGCLTLARGILEKSLADRGKRGMIALEGRRS